MSDNSFDLVVIGGGAAGLSAAIYGGRSGLDVLLLEKEAIGGQTVLSPLIENYPGFESVSGPDLMQLFRKQADKYAVLKEWIEVDSIEPKGEEFHLSTPSGAYVAKAVILSTGASHRRLGVPGETEYSGRGVSYCATCDGFFFKNKKVVVVGGGNTALTEAIYLLNLGAQVSLVHRRDKLRGEVYLEETFRRLGGVVHWNSVVESIEGSDKVQGNVTGVVLKNILDNSTRVQEAGGVFIAVGITPNNSLAESLGVELNNEGYITARHGQKTNVPGVYAAGDNCEGLRQIVTGAAAGAVAAVSAHAQITDRPWSQ